MPATLLGLFAAAESSGVPTSGSRTTVAGSLITVACGAFAVAAVSTPSDNKSNTYTEQVDLACESGNNARVSLSYNIGGTRGASHTVTKADDGNNAIGGQEWDGVAASPTVASATTAFTTSTDPNASVAVGAASLAVLVYGYGGASTTFEDTSPATGTPGQEIDENSDQQDVCARYSVGQTGTVALHGKLAASRSWGAGIVCFTEAAAASQVPYQPWYQQAPVMAQ